jgi:hypothetical protein
MLIHAVRVAYQSIGIDSRHVLCNGTVCCLRIYTLFFSLPQRIFHAVLSDTICLGGRQVSVDRAEE